MAAWRNRPRRKAPDGVSMPLSVASLADACGVSRQRIYTLVKEGLINAIPMAGGYVIMPQEVKRVLRLTTKVKVKGGGQQTRFDFSQI
jgi:hypothetical protein